MAWSRSAMARSDPFISAIFASTSLSPSALLFSAFSSLARSLIAARSSAVNPWDFLPVPFAGFCVVFLGLMETSIDYSARARFGHGRGRAPIRAGGEQRESDGDPEDRVADGGVRGG